MGRKGVELLVGLFVLAGAVALLFLALRAANLGSFSSGPSYAVSAKFDNIGGLKPRAPVKSAGVVVGRVSSIGFDNVSFQAVVNLDLDRRYEFPLDTSAKILTSGLLGEQYVGLEAGGDEKNLKSGDAIRVTQSAVVLENLISQFLFSKAESQPGQAPAAGK
ncbi:MAG: outer membrane lipid asymmetry maintenance protein MlaD [Burkholderiaceae bacterium]